MLNASLKLHFNPRSPCGERRGTWTRLFRCSQFQSTLPVRGATLGLKHLSMSLKFQSTLPVRGATARNSITARPSRFQSTLPVRGATQGTTDADGEPEISIHAPRAGSDATCSPPTHSLTHFNPRSPCGERRFASAVRCRVPHFNPRSPCGERRVLRFSANPPLAFQSTLPVRGATVASWFIKFTVGISIHAPRAGSDSRRRGRSPVHRDFNPRSPCGERRRSRADRGRFTYFNPRSPCGERQNPAYLEALGT